MRCWVLTIVLGCLPAVLGTGAARAATKLDGFPAKLEGIADAASPLAVDLDGDGRLELVAASRVQVAAFEADGSPVRGFPVTLPKGQGVATGLCAGAWGGARPALLWGTPDGGLMALEGDGRPRAGFPVDVGRAAGAPSLADVDGDGRLEALVGGADGRLHALTAEGKELPGFPVQVGAPVSTAVSAGRFAPGGELLLFFGDEQGRLHARRRSGTEAAGFPYDARNAITSQPVLGDIDDDGRFELIFGAVDYHIHAVTAEGKAAPGFPVKTGYRIYAACALADLDDDGVAEVLATSGDGLLYAVDGRGRPAKGFPVRVGNRPRSAPVVGDLDADGRPEIAVGSDQGRLYLLRSDGKDYPGFPAALGEAVDSAPLLAVLTGGDLEQLAVLTHDGTLNVFKFLRKGKAAPAAVWPSEARDAARTGRSGPNPARYTSLAVEPERPTTRDALRARYRFFDLDGDAEPAGLLRWYRDGTHEKALDGAREVPAERTRKHERWHFSLQAREGERVFRCPPVEIANTPPAAPEVQLAPEPARTEDELGLKVGREAEDPDGDRIAYRVTWLRDREPVPALKGMTVPARLTAKGQRWTAVVTPSDGEADGPPARASLLVVNTAPTAPRVRLVPGAPGVTQAVELRVEQPGRDADGDPVRYLTRWSAAGRELALPEDALSLPPGFAPKHTELSVRVTAFDGTDRGGQSVAQAKVENTPPAAPGLAIHPANPSRADALEARVTREAADPDRDPVALRLAWSRQGKPLAGALAGAAYLPAGEGRRGERWTLVATPWDGEALGAPARAEVVLGNAPPPRPTLRAVDPRPPSDADLVVELAAPLADADGDRLSLEVAWLEDGREVARGPELRLPAARTRKHARYLARVSARDGQAAGPPAEVGFEVQNSPPGACQVAIAPDAPRTGDALRAKLAAAPVDRDGDAVQLTYRWSRDGLPIQAAGPGDAIPGEQVRRDQRWSVRVTPTDGEAAGLPCEASVLVGNRPPSAPRVRLLPEQPRSGDDLVVEIVQPALDPEGDAVGYQLEWQRGGEIRQLGSGHAWRLPASETRKAERWRVRVTPRDASAAGPAGEAECVIANSPPAAPLARAVQPRPHAGEDLVVALERPARDPDGDPVSLEVVWSEAGRELARGRELLRLPATRVRKHGLVTARLTPSDGAAAGPAVEVGFEVQNSPPAACQVAIEPAQPRTGDGLRARVAVRPADPDGDAVELRYAWSRDGQSLPAAAGSGEAVAGQEVRRGQRWVLRAVPFDGEVEGPACQAEAVVVNQPPLPPQPQLAPAAPRATEALVLRFAAPPRDPDGDPVQLTTRWSLDGQPVPGGVDPGGLPAGVLRKGQRWAVEVVASDGELASPVARAEAMVANSPPAIPALAIRPESPTSADELECVLRQATPDPDGDAAEHTFAWYLVTAEPRAAPTGEPRLRGARLPASASEKGQRWVCVGVATDGALAGEPGWVGAGIGNAPPGQAEVDLQPSSPGDDDGLRCALVKPAVDPDGDALRYKVRWTKDGVVQPFAEETEVVPARLTRSRDIWQCSLVATDGQAEGPATFSPEVIIR
ncbi:MAG TPA: hypothetical protein PK668_19740 [Myxococcota bacterium]|nr:hypothetical protein [Myxococcota bacterium]HRY95034.1 hypothetical protein [Myxococcota bacterium]HSA21095.1 hypothetical protein [Myxococcota bacterium]